MGPGTFSSRRIPISTADIPSTSHRALPSIDRSLPPCPQTPTAFSPSVSVRESLSLCFLFCINSRVLFVCILCSVAFSCLVWADIGFRFPLCFAVGKPDLAIAIVFRSVTSAQKSGLVWSSLEWWFLFSRLSCELQICFPGLDRFRL